MSIVIFCSTVTLFLTKIAVIENDRWHRMAQLFEALRYKPEVRVFDYRYCHSDFSLA